MTTQTIPAADIRPMDKVGNRLVQLAYTCGKKSRTTSVNFYDGTSAHYAPDQPVEVTRR